MIYFKYIYLANVLGAFSVTSAALDLSTVITAQGNPNTYVYGVSYGTYLVERLMQLDTTTRANDTSHHQRMIQGYILDGVVSQSGSAKGEMTSFASWDADVGAIGERFLQLCGDDPSCRKKLTPDPVAFVKTLYARLDQELLHPTNNTCDHLLRSGVHDAISPVSSSIAMRRILHFFLQSQMLRVLIPVRYMF